MPPTPGVGSQVFCVKCQCHHWPLRCLEMTSWNQRGWGVGPRHQGKSHRCSCPWPCSRGSTGAHRGVPGVDPTAGARAGQPRGGHQRRRRWAQTPSASAVCVAWTESCPLCTQAPPILGCCMFLGLRCRSVWKLQPRVHCHAPRSVPRPWQTRGTQPRTELWWKV